MDRRHFLAAALLIGATFMASAAEEPAAKSDGKKVVLKITGMT